MSQEVKESCDQRPAPHLALSTSLLKYIERQRPGKLSLVSTFLATLLGGRMAKGGMAVGMSVRAIEATVVPGH